MKKALSILVVFLLFCIASGVAMAQGITTGTINGTVEDQTGALVAGAEVTVTSSATGTAMTAKSSNKGEFTLSNVPVGAYTLTIKSGSFAPFTLSQVFVESGKTLGLGAEKLSVGASENLEVTAAQSLLETVQSQVTTTFDSSQIQNLPTGGGFDELALLVPGVVSTHGNNRSNTNGAGISSNGQRGRNNNFEIDGQSNNDNSVAGPQVFFENQDALAEVQVISNSFGAQYGRDAGTVVNYITKSGTNSIHGSAFEYYEGNFLSSLTPGEKNPALTGPSSLNVVPRFVDNTFGGSLGAPVLKDRLWGFGSALFSRNFNGPASSTTTTYFPTPAGISQLAAAYPGNPGVASLAAYNPYTVTIGNPTPIVQATTKTISVTNGTLTQVIPVAPFTRTIPSFNTDEEVLGRLDYQATPKDRFFIKYFYQLNPTFAGSGTVSTGGFVNVSNRTHAVAGDYTRTITSNLLNQLRYSFQQSVLTFDGGGFSGCTVSNLTNCPANFSLGKGTDVVTGTSLTLSGFGLGTSYPQGRIVKDTQIQDNLTWIKGAHNIAIGGGYELQNSPNIFLPNISGSFTFASISSLLQGTASSVGLAAGDAHIHFKENDVNAYFQDDWKISSSFTANLGLRWEFFGNPINLLNDLSVARQTGPNPLFNTALPLSFTTFPRVKNVYTNFEPRIGFAWNPSNMKALVVRGAYSLNLSPQYNNIGLNSYGSAPVLISASILGCNNATKPCLPAGGANYTSVHALDNQYLPTGVSPGIYNQTLVAPNFHQPKTSTYTIGLQYQISRFAVAEARYVGAHTSGDFQSINANPNIAAAIKQFPTLFPGVSYCTDATQPGVNHLNCASTNVRARLNTSFEIYNGLQTSLTSRNYHGVTATLAYTWSRTIDNASEIFGTAGAATTVAFSQNPLDPNVGERGVSGNSYPNVTSLGLTYVVPLFKGQHNLKATLLGGFQLNTIYLFNSGQPFTPAQYYFDGSYCDINFGTTFIGNEDACRPILANPAAPIGTVGVNNGNNTYSDYSTGAAGPRSQFHWLVNNQAEAKVIGTPFGGVSRNTLRGNTFNNADISIYKNNQISERFNLQLQMNVFNALNRAYYGAPDVHIDNEGAQFLNYNYNGGSNRNVQLGAKILF